MKKEIRITPVIIVLIVVMSPLMFLIEYEAFDLPSEQMMKPRPGFEKHIDRVSDKLTERILKLVQADSAQTIQIQQVSSKMAEQVRKIGRDSRLERRQIIDSFRIQLRSILTDEQFKRLDEIQTPFPRSVE
jgi:hypothetical protein